MEQTVTEKNKNEKEEEKQIEAKSSIQNKQILDNFILQFRIKESEIVKKEILGNGSYGTVFKVFHRKKERERDGETERNIYRLRDRNTYR